MSKQLTWLLIRGLTTGAYHWNDFPLNLANAWPQADILTPDLPGNGERWQESSPTSISTMVTAYRQQIHSQPLRLIALSMGGMVALQWLKDYPDEIDQVILINTSVGGLQPFYQRIRGQSLCAILWAEFKGKKARKKAILKYTTSSRGKDDELARDWADYEQFHPVGLINFLRQLWAAAHFTLDDGLASSLSEKVIVISSSADKLVSSQCSHCLAKKLNSPLVCHPTAGHDLTLDDGQWLIKKISELENKNKSQDCA